MASELFEIAVQRRLRAPIAALGGAGYSPTLQRRVDTFGDALQNLHAHGARHAQPLKKWHNAFRAVWAGQALSEDARHGIYCPGVRPDLTVKNGSRDGTHHHIYEQKVVSPTASTEDGTGSLGSRVAFGNTAEKQYELILGAPASGGSDACDGAYAGAVERGHSVTPIVLETTGGFHPDAWRAIRELARRHGSRLGADELTAPWCAQSFLSIHVMRISVALQLAAAVEILDTIQTDQRAQARPEK